MLQGSSFPIKRSVFKEGVTSGHENAGLQNDESMSRARKTTGPGEKPSTHDGHSHGPVVFLARLICRLPLLHFPSSPLQRRQPNAQTCYLRCVNVIDRQPLRNSNAKLFVIYRASERVNS